VTNWLAVFSPFLPYFPPTSLGKSLESILKQNTDGATVNEVMADESGAVYVLNSH